METYVYTALTDTGEKFIGHIEADSAASARQLLAKRGYIPTNVKAQRAASDGTKFDFRDYLAEVSVPDLILFTKQMGTMLSAGIPIMRLFNILEAQTENPKLKGIVSKITADVSSGSSLTEAFARHPKVFSRLYISMLRSGEASGALPEVLERLIYVIEHEAKVKAEVKSALQYPIIVLGFLGVAFLILLTFVVPKFATMFERAKIDMPLPTQICMAMYNFLNDYWVFMLIALVAGGVSLYFYLKTAQGQLVKDTMFLNLPIIGPLFIKSAMSRFASVFAILQASGVPVLESVNIISTNIGNSAISRQFDKVKEKLTSGHGLSEPLEEAKYFTPMVINMVAIGEESGSLEILLKEVATHYDYEVEYATKRLTDAIGPILMVGLAAMVGFFAMAVFLPMWAMMDTVK